MKRNRSNWYSFNQENFASDSKCLSVDNTLRRCYLENKIMEEFLARESLSEENDSPSGASEKEREFFEGAAYRAAAIDLSEWPKDVRTASSRSF